MVFRVLGGPWRAGRCLRRGLQPARSRFFESLWGRHRVGWIVFSLRSGREKKGEKTQEREPEKGGDTREGSRERSKMGGVQREAKGRAGRGRSKELLRGRERDRCRERKWERRRVWREGKGARREGKTSRQQRAGPREGLCLPGPLVPDG